MIVACPGCGRRYRIPDDGGAHAGRRLRCSACQRVFDPAPPTGGQPVAPEGRAATPLLVLLGDEDREFRHLVRRTLESFGCKVEVTDDGEAAFRYAVARRPALMVLNVYLKRLLGVAVCEGVKGSPDLRGTRVVLVGSVFKSGRFIRTPGNLYGADDYFEDVIPEAQLRARLQGHLGRLGAASQGFAAGMDSSGGPSAGPAEMAANGADEPIDPRSEIRRLARIMISDLRIYHPDGFVKAIQERRFSEEFREELAQAKDLIGRRFPGLPDRMTVLSEALKEQIAEVRADAAPRGPGSFS